MPLSRKTPMKRTEMKKKLLRRDWSDARAKVSKEGRCRLCGHIPASESLLEAAHLVGCKYDPVMAGPRGGKYLYVEPDSIVPLCGPFTHGNCHMRFDKREVSLIGVLDIREYRYAIKLCRSVGIDVRRRLGGAGEHLRDIRHPPRSEQTSTSSRQSSLAKGRGTPDVSNE
jgi:hypothetical protein